MTDDSLRQRLIDADHAIRLQDIELSRLRAENGNLEREAIDRQARINGLLLGRAGLVQEIERLEEEVRRLKARCHYCGRTPTDSPCCMTAVLDAEYAAHDPSGGCQVMHLPSERQPARSVPSAVRLQRMCCGGPIPIHPHRHGRPGDVSNELGANAMGDEPPIDPWKAFAFFVSKCASGFCGELIAQGRTATQARNAAIGCFLDFAAGEACRVAREEGREPDPSKWLKATTDAFERAVRRTEDRSHSTPEPAPTLTGMDEENEA